VGVPPHQNTSTPNIQGKIDAKMLGKNSIKPYELKEFL
jgi:hypothetical protein